MRAGASPEHDVGGSAAEATSSAAAELPAGDVGGAPAVAISSSTTSAPTWGPHGYFHWEVAFSTTGRGGWLVQEIVNTRHPQNASGAALPDGLTPRYWEAWAVDAAGAITPQSGATHDFWQRRSWGSGTKGNWRMTGALHFTKKDPATMGFTVGGAPEAGGLLAATSAPSGLGAVHLSRHADGTWDSTTATPTHTGTAGP